VYDVHNQDSSLSEFGSEVEDTTKHPLSFMIETNCVLCELRIEDEEICEH
jgi:hypothetical protein